MKKLYESPKAEIVSYSTPDVMTVVLNASALNLKNGTKNVKTYESLNF